MFTVDVITPIVDDPRTFGRIAATNALSDIYAMGARPLMALNVACFSPTVPVEALREILAGAGDVGLAAACPVLGGHTVKDSEIKFGLAVIGEVHPDRLLTNAGAKPGDALVLAKPIGTSALATALKSGRIDETNPWFVGFIESMTFLNDGAAKVALSHGAHALTDITGFGLSGHLMEMARASGVTLRVDFDAVPQLEGALTLLAEGFTCGGGKANAEYATGKLALDGRLKPEQIELLHDPQTAGPLLLSLPADQADEAVSELKQAGYRDAARIGMVHEASGNLLEVC